MQFSISWNSPSIRSDLPLSKITRCNPSGPSISPCALLAGPVIWLMAGEVNRRRDDVARWLVGQLNDPLAEIRFDDLDAVIGESFVQADLLGDHRFRLDDRLTL